MMWHHGWGSWWVIMPLGMVIFFGGLLWVVFMLSRPRAPSAPDPWNPEIEAERFLDIRYATGEIDDREYQHRLAVLRGTEAPDP